MTVLSDILPLLLAVLEDGRFFGTVNAVNPGFVDHDWILQTYGHMSGKPHSYVLEPYEQQSKRLLSKRSNNVLDTSRLQSWRAFLSADLAKKYNLPATIPSLRESILVTLEKRMHKENPA